MVKIHPTAWVAPGAVLRGDITIGEQVSIWYNAVLRADQETITVGRGSNIQDNCVLHGDPGHDITIGENVTVGHGAILHGCTVEDQCLIGMNAVVLDNTVIGRGSIVGAGAVVGSGQTIPPRSLVLGVPAKVKKTLTEEESAGNLENIEEYFGLMAPAMADGVETCARRGVIARNVRTLELDHVFFEGIEGGAVDAEGVEVLRKHP